MRCRCGGLPLVLTVLVALPLAAPALVAHHSVPGQFDVSKSVTLKGTISDVKWMNPHIYILLDVKGEDGAVTTWSLETLPTAMARRAGLSKELLMGKPGEMIEVAAVPAWDASKHLAFISKITYPDGRFYQLGSAATR